VPVVPSISFKGRMVAANRVTFMGKGESEVYAGWDNLAEATANLALNIRLSIVRIPLLQYEIKKLRNTQRTFKFDVAKEQDRKILEQNFNRVVPHNIPQQYALKQRSTRSHQRSFSLGFFRFYRKTSSLRSIRVDY